MQCVVCLQLLRPCDTDVLRRCKYMLRKQHYHELTVENPIQALTYLQQSLAETVDHSDTNETDEVRILLTQTFIANAIQLLYWTYCSFSNKSAFKTSY